jgi:arsenate reductase (thioredoxin)
MERFIIAFVCTGNPCRSQMAEGFARFYGSSLLEAYSAGTHPAKRVDPDAIAAMKELGIDISSQYPKILEEIPATPDILITMGCGVECPYIPSSYREDWGLENPVGGSPEKFKEVRDLIEQKIIELVNKLKNVNNINELNGTMKKV